MFSLNFYCIRRFTGTISLISYIKLHLSSVCRIKCLGKIYKEKCGLKIFCTYFFNDLTNSQNLRCGLISPKTILIFSWSFSILGWIQLRSSKSYTSWVLYDFDVAFFICFSIMFWLYIALHNKKLANISVSTIMMLYKSKKAMVHSHNDDTCFFDIIARVLQGDTLALFQFIICWDKIEYYKH